MGNANQNAEKIYELQNKYFQIRDSASESEILALAEECYNLGYNEIYKHIAISAPEETLEQLEKKLEYCSLAEQHGADVSDIKEMVNVLIEMEKMDFGAPVVMTPEDSAKKILEAQQIVMELAKAQETNTLWTCSYCNTSNTGKFCQNCGAPRP